MNFSKVTVFLLLLIIFFFLPAFGVRAACTPGDCQPCRPSTCCCNQPCNCPGYCGHCTAADCGRCITGEFDQYCCDETGNWGMVCCGGCFTGETEVDVKFQDSSNKTQKISKLKEEDIVSSFNPETGEITEGTVGEVTKITREGYYELETESGEKVKVTAEHPFLVVENESFIAKLKEIFSQTLTYQLITDFQTKIAEVVK